MSNDKRRNCRLEPRTNLLLSASCRIGQKTSPCKIRNLSPNGALVQAALCPPKLATVSLSRGDLDAVGEVAWTEADCFGIHFATPIDIGRWLPGEVGSTDHSKVDEAPDPVALQKAEDRALRLDIRLAEEAAFVSRLIGNAASVLVKDPVLRVRHAIILQQLTIADEMLQDLKNVLQADDKMGAVATRVRGPMRRRLLRDVASKDNF